MGVLKGFLRASRGLPGPSIDLTSNPLECDCKLLWLKDLLSSIKAMHTAQCKNFGVHNYFNSFLGAFWGLSGGFKPIGV